VRAGKVFSCWPVAGLVLAILIGINHRLEIT
jgi:hypothetical protein